MNDLSRRLGIEFPLIQAGMGGIAGAELAAAVAGAGAGGVVALYRMPRQYIREVLERTRAMTSRPFGVNLIPELLQARALADQVEAVLAASDERVFFTFYGLPDSTVTARLREARRAFLVMVGSADDAKVAARIGATAVILQGIEAGGHLLGVQSLDRLIAEYVAARCDVPFLASGSVGCGHDFRRLATLGAAGCVCGTMFVATCESRAHPRYKERLVDASPSDTTVTDVFDIGWPKRPHRVLRNSLTTSDSGRLPNTFIAEATLLGARHPIPRYSAMVPTVETRGSLDEMAMYCGVSVRHVREVVPARALVERFVAEFNAREQAGNAASHA